MSHSHELQHDPRHDPRHAPRRDPRRDPRSDPRSDPRPDPRHDPRPDADSPKRQAVLEAARTLFMTQGYGAVSMDSISRAAGVSKATLYAYFASKDVLFATIIKEACLHNMALAGALPDLAVDLAAALTGLGQRVLRFLLEDQALAIHRVVMAESVRFPELGRAFYDNGPDHFRRLFSAWLDEQVKAGRLVVDDVGIASDQFVGMLRSTGVYLRASLGLPPRPTEAEINATVTGAVRTFLKAYAVA